MELFWSSSLEGAARPYLICPLSVHPSTVRRACLPVRVRIGVSGEMLAPAACDRPVTAPLDHRQVPNRYIGDSNTIVVKKAFGNDTT
jgi:hypothetical protein